MTEPTTPASGPRKSIDWGIVFAGGLFLTVLALGAWVVDQLASGATADAASPTDFEDEIQRLEVEVRDAERALDKVRMEAKLDNQPANAASWRDLIATREAELRATRLRLDELRER